MRHMATEREEEEKSSQFESAFEGGLGKPKFERTVSTSGGERRDGNDVGDHLWEKKGQEKRTAVSERKKATRERRTREERDER